MLRAARTLSGLCVAMLASAGALAAEKPPACEPPKPDALVRIRLAESFGVEDLVQQAARSSCVEYRFDRPLARRMVPGPVDIQVRAADLDAIYAILFRTMNIGVEGHGKTRQLVATGPEPAESLAVVRLDEEITKIDEGHARITRRGLDEVLGSMSGLARSARVVPESRNGKIVGFRLFSIRPQSAFDLVGFQNGDVVLSMNDIPMTTPDKALEAYTKVRTSDALRLGLERRGAPIALEVKIVPGPHDVAAVPPPTPPPPSGSHRRTFTRAELDDAFHNVRLRMVPAGISKGVRHGIMLFGVSKVGPVLEAAGFEDADCVAAINGHPVSTPEDFLRAYDAAVRTNRIEFRLYRIGRPPLVVYVK